MPDILIVVAKKPAPGQTKTRLCPPLTFEQAAGLYECFLRDTLDIMRQVTGVQYLIGYLPDQALDYFRHLAPDMNYACQRGETLGERLDHLFRQGLAEGPARVVIMDSDSPTLPAAYVQQAFTRLVESDVVIGPTPDGGYYLIGMRAPQSHLLLGVQMSTPHVLTDTLELAESTSLSVSLLPRWYDVDTVTDLERLQVEIVGDKKNKTAFHSRRWLAQVAWSAKKPDPCAFQSLSQP